MPLFEFEGKRPQVHPSAFVAPTATLVGDVVVEEGASVWYGAVIRGDYSQVRIGKNANVQDGSVLHGPPQSPCTIGAGATIAHLCVVHGAVIGEGTLIGNAAVVLDGAKIGARTMIAAGALVTPGTEIPDEVLVVGSPAKVKGPIAGTGAQMWVKANGPAYAELAARHRDGIRPL